MMSVDFTTKELYGGAIVVKLPSDIVDASDLRQVPDHQEVFLSDKTLTSIIFEINQYQHALPPASRSQSQGQSQSEDSTLSADQAAASYHLNDVIEPPDHLSASGIQTSTIQLSQASVIKCPAYQSIATIISPEVDRFVRSTLPIGWQTDPAQKDFETANLQLLIRLREYGTDICVRINVPLRELGDAQSEAAQIEGSKAIEVMRNIIESFDIKDFGLFGA